MATSISFYQHLLEKFAHYSTEELIHLNNETIKSQGWGSSRATFRTAIISAFSKKGVDLSHIVTKNDGFTSILSVPVKLVENTLIPISCDSKS
ncbi:MULTISPECIES: 5-oxoprolinase [Sphingobacterium]|uniref:5-oxoprolinase n=1 Tax=Sphingobacterium TaxID=28453 RepID=UPI0013DA0520|nr:MULTISPECIES: 5-oxoprolinase [unclassified Sphingobacterium]